MGIRVLCTLVHVKNVQVVFCVVNHWLAGPYEIKKCPNTVYVGNIVLLDFLILDNVLRKDLFYL